MLVAERAGVGFTLHRSETVAHSAGLLDRKNSAASSRARGRSEGFACKHSDTYKPLGAPVPPDRVLEIYNSTMIKVKKIEKEYGRDALQHQDKSEAERNRRREKELEQRNAALLQQQRAIPTSPDAKDAIKDEQTVAGEAGLEADREEMPSLSNLPHALYGKDLPRCGQVQERQEKDGFKELKVHIKGSFHRLEQVKADADAAYEARKENMQLALPSPRHPRPASPSEDGGSAFLTSIDIPQSARDTHRQARQQPQPLSARRPSRQVQLPKVTGQKRGNWLPSLAEYLASDGAGVPASLGGERTERADVIRDREIVTKIVSELLPLPKGNKPNYGNLLDEGKAGGSKGRWVQRRKQLEKDLGAAWTDKAFYQRCNPHVAQKDAEEMRQRYHGDDFKLATLERFLKDLGVNEELKGVPTAAEVERASSNPADAAGLPGVAGPASPVPDAAQDKRRGGDPDDEGNNKGLQRLNMNDQRQQNEPGKLVAARARVRAIQHKALSQLREPDRQERSPYAGLRIALKDYQAMRDKARERLQETLDFQEKSRMDSVEAPRRRALPSGVSLQDADACESRQNQWYRSLLEQVRTQLDSSDVSKAVHLFLDSVRNVLDQGAEFEADDFWLCVSEFESDDVTTALASLLVSGMSGIEGLTGPSVVRALQQQCGDLNPEVAEMLSAH